MHELIGRRRSCPRPRRRRTASPPAGHDDDDENVDDDDDEDEDDNKDDDEAEAEDEGDPDLVELGLGGGVSVDHAAAGRRLLGGILLDPGDEQRLGAGVGQGGGQVTEQV